MRQEELCFRAFTWGVFVTDSVGLLAGLAKVCTLFYSALPYCAVVLSRVCVVLLLAGGVFVNRNSVSFDLRLNH